MTAKQLVRVQDVMQDSFVLVDGMITVHEALQQIRSRGAHCLIVNKRHDNDEYGIVLLSDIAKRVLARDRAPERVNVYEIMSKPVVGLKPGMDVRYCARLFENIGISTAPVIRNEQVIGVVRYDEIVLQGLLNQ